MILWNFTIVLITLQALLFSNIIYFLDLFYQYSE